MAAYLERIAAADLDGLGAIIRAAESDNALTAAQYYHIRQKATERGTRILFDRA
jgi:hypothetical protein